MAGKLISAIQKEWGEETGEPFSIESEDVMNLAHTLLQARNANGMLKILGEKTIQNFLGKLWVENHPSVKPEIHNLEMAIEDEFITSQAVTTCKPALTQRKTP